MNTRRAHFDVQIGLILLSGLMLIWAVVFYELQRSHDAHLHEANVRTLTQAKVFAEYSRSTLKRINEFILNARSEWNGDWKSFAAFVRRAQENIDDVVLQVAIIDAQGILAFSNLARPSDRTDLSEREHFRVHKDMPDSDRLFVSRPLKGKVSGKWSIQVTRPILRDGRFDGVIVVSIAPDQFAAFAEKLGTQPGEVLTVVRTSGEIMARYPSGDTGLGLVLKDRPFLGPGASPSGNYRQVSSVDGEDRIWGYSTLPEYGMVFVIGTQVTNALKPHFAHRQDVLIVATLVSLMAAVLLFLLYRSLGAEEKVRLQLAEIFALSPDGFVSFDRARRVSIISPAFLEMTGLKEGELVGLDEAEFSMRLALRCNPQARFHGTLALRQALETGAGGTADSARPRHDTRQRIELAGAGQRVLEVGLRLSVTPDVSQILYCRDITHEVEVDRMKSEFLSTAAHELRTPMASIYGYTELLLQREFPAADRRDFLETIYRQASLIVSIINELLDLARIEARRGKDFEIVSLDLGAVVRETLAEFVPPSGRNPPVLVAGEDRHYRVDADRKKFIQVIGNVLSNAYKYSPDGGDVEVMLLQPTETGSETLRQVGVRIADRGIGMTPEQLGRVCERFYRADTSGKIPGTGLGMSIVKEIIELLGGNIEIGSQVGKGTQVTLWLPVSETGRSA